MNNLPGAVCPYHDSSDGTFDGGIANLPLVDATIWTYRDWNRDIPFGRQACTPTMTGFTYLTGNPPDQNIAPVATIRLCDGPAPVALGNTPIIGARVVN
jgi:hypothetical protein